MAIKFIDKYPNQTVRALSWKQPFASLMLYGKVETRSWDSKYHGWVLICASAKSYNSKQLLHISGKEQILRISTVLLPDDVQLGKAIAIGKLWRSVKMDDCMINPPKSKEDNLQNIATNKIIADSCFVTPQSGLWMHHYSDVQAIEPFDWKGKLGWQTLDEETKSKIILI